MTPHNIPCAETIIKDIWVRCCGWASINAKTEVEYATFRFVIFQRYSRRTPLKRNSSLNASKNITKFQYTEFGSILPHHIINVSVAVITNAPRPKRKLTESLSFLTPVCISAVLILLFSR